MGFKLAIVSLGKIISLKRHKGIATFISVAQFAGISNL